MYDGFISDETELKVNLNIHILPHTIEFLLFSWSINLGKEELKPGNINHKGNENCKAEK
jgi:hypothetical protein